MPSDSDSETEMVEIVSKTQRTGVVGGAKRPLSEAKLKALELARVKAAQKAKQRSAVTKAAKEAERAKKMADKVSAFALQQKARAIEAGLIHETPAAPVEAPSVPSHLDDIKSELQALRELLSKPALSPVAHVKKPKKTARPNQTRQQPPMTAPPPTRVDTLKAMLGR